MDLSDHRVNYEADGLDIARLAADPIAQFREWFAEAQAANDPEPYSMVLSTVDADGRPRGRYVLLRAVDSDGFVFFTNYASAKARAMESTRYAALTFRWFDLHRQVNIEGTVRRVAAAESDAYFAKRPRESQLGAWASEQSTEIEDRSVLIERLSEVTQRFEGREVDRPDFWGGYRVTPDRIEFWQGQPSRLHDRALYVREGEKWTRSVLSP